MTLLQASIRARRFSIRYGYWYVRLVKEGNYQPYAHSSEDSKTVRTYFNGNIYLGD